MPCQAAQCGNAARAEALFPRQLRREGAPGRWRLKRAGAAVDNSLYLRNGQLTAGGHCCDLALTNWIGNFQQHLRERERQVAAVEHPLHLLIQLEQNQTGVDSRRRYANAAR
jgi:hypothetical protein